jgi:sugar lactone lactonase YvrE
LTVAGGNGIGDGLNQLFRPVGLYVDDDQTVYVADNENHRILEWKCGAINGEVVVGGNGQGNEINQLNHPSDVIVDKDGNHLIICDLGNKRVIRCPRQNGNNAQIIISNIDCCRLTIDNNGYFYISDREKHEVRRWKVNDTCGTLVAGGNGKGDKLNQLNNPTFIFVDEDHSIYVSDFYNHRVMKWMEGATEGIVVAGGQGKGNSLTQLSNPQGVVVDDVGSVFVADFNNNRIMCWPKGAIHGNIVVGRHGQGEQADQLNRPMGLSLNQQGDLYVVDQWNARVQRFNFDRH